MHGKWLVRCYAQLLSYYMWPNLVHLALGWGTQVTVAADRHKTSSLVSIHSTNSLQYRNGREGERKREGEWGGGRRLLSQEL